ncbi:LapA family protein, partial [Gordonia sp. (in: high G+C Gram-positive bacteria)]
IWLLFWQVNLPVGISLLIAAIAGALVTALIGGLRMFQLNRALTKASKADH